MFEFHKRDANEKSIIAALTAIGAVVSKIQGIADGDGGFGVPDLIVGHRGKTLLIEVKNPNSNAHTARTTNGKRTKGVEGPAENAKGLLTRTQIAWWSAWIGGEAYVVESAEQAVRLVKGAELPVDLSVAADEDGVLVAWNGIDGVRRVLPRMSADQARALAGALHEQAAVAQAMSKKTTHG